MSTSTKDVLLTTRWILWPNWQHWCPDLERTWPGRAGRAVFMPGLRMQVRFHAEPHQAGPRRPGRLYALGCKYDFME